MPAQALITKIHLSGWDISAHRRFAIALQVAYFLVPLGRDKVTDLAIKRSSKLHPPVRISEDFSDFIAGTRQRIFNDFAGSGVEPPESVIIEGVVPNKVVAIDANAIRRRIGAGQPKFLESFCVRVEATKLARKPLIKPNHSPRV